MPLGQPHDQLDGLRFGFAHFVFGDLQRAYDASCFGRALLYGFHHCRESAARHLDHGADIHELVKAFFRRGKNMRRRHQRGLDETGFE